MSGPWVRVDEVLWRRTLDGMVARTPGGETLTLSSAAAALLELLERPRTAAELAAELAGATGTPVAAVHPDVDALLRDLAGHHVVREAG